MNEPLSDLIHRFPIPTGITSSTAVGLFGRKAELDALNHAIEDEGAFVVLSGTGGTGKSSLLAAWARALDRSVVWIRDPDNSAFPDLPIDELATQGAVVIIDDLDSLDPGRLGLTIRHLREVARAGVRVIAASRFAISVPEATSIHLEPLTFRASQQLLRAASVSEALVDRLASGLQGVPLALVVAARLGANQPDALEDLLDQFASEPSRLETLTRRMGYGDDRWRIVVGRLTGGHIERRATFRLTFPDGRLPSRARVIGHEDELHVFADKVWFKNGLTDLETDPATSRPACPRT